VATTREAVQINAIVPTLTVDDLQKSIAFYEALGFAIDERWEEQGTLLGAFEVTDPNGFLLTVFSETSA
jgi:catechol 2,3-dioxygenase-like lactoylglutathione lyase family enzyme